MRDRNDKEIYKKDNSVVGGGVKCELYNDHMQNFKPYGIPKAQLIIGDIPYGVGDKAFGSNPQWYVDGDNKNGESELAHSSFFDTDEYFRMSEFMDFVSRMLKPEPKHGGERGRASEAPCMILFCAFEQQQYLIDYAARYGFEHYIPLVFIKNYSPQVLKANMRICGACEYALVFYRRYLPKFRNRGHMIFNWFKWERDGADVPKIHPTQKPVNVLERLIEIFTDPGDVVIDPCAGSGSTLRAAYNLGRNSYGFEIKKDFYKAAKEQMLNFDAVQLRLGDI
jgi:site-specific DNA-methyltransferase (adenine-specific)